jgi:hypothetical protein
MRDLHKTGGDRPYQLFSIIPPACRVLSFRNFGLLALGNFSLCDFPGNHHQASHLSLSTSRHFIRCSACFAHESNDCGHRNSEFGFKSSWISRPDVEVM